MTDLEQRLHSELHNPMKRDCDPIVVALAAIHEELKHIRRALTSRITIHDDQPPWKPLVEQVVKDMDEMVLNETALCTCAVMTYDKKCKYCLEQLNKQEDTE